MIIYFSGTGNSYFVAEGLSQILDDELISLVDLMRKNKPTNFNSEKPYVFVGPTHAGRLPVVFRNFIEKGNFSGSNRAYVIMTCGEKPYDAIKTTKDSLQKANFNLKGFSYVVMPNNYIFMKDTPDEETAKQMIAEARKKTIELGNMIKEGKTFIETTGGFSNLIMSSIGYAFTKPSFNSKKFKNTERCIGCGLCVSLCPFKSIKLENQKPKWNGECMHCMACISACPNGAIEYGKKTQGKRRYYLEEKF